MPEKLNWSDVNEENYERFLTTSYNDYIENYSKYTSVSHEEAKAEIPPPEIKKGPRDIWRYIYLDAVEVGYIWFYPQKDGNSAFLLDIHFYPGFRGKGFGSQCMKMLKDYLLSMNIGILDLNVFRQNIPAVRLYEKLGFKQISTTESGIMMRWILDNTKTLKSSTP